MKAKFKMAPASGGGAILCIRMCVYLGKHIGLALWCHPLKFGIYKYPLLPETGQSPTYSTTAFDPTPIPDITTKA